MCQNLGIWRYIIILHHNHVTLINPFNAPNFYKKGVFFIRKKKRTRNDGKGSQTRNKVAKSFPQNPKIKKKSGQQTPVTPTRHVKPLICRFFANQEVTGRILFGNPSIFAHFPGLFLVSLFASSNNVCWEPQMSLDSLACSSHFILSCRWVRVDVLTGISVGYCRLALEFMISGVHGERPFRTDCAFLN